MPTSPEEQEDLDAMMLRLRGIYEGCINICAHYERMTLDELKPTGNRTKEEAIVRAVRGTLARKAQLLAAHIKKWPDK